MRIDKKLETKEVEVRTYVSDDGTCFKYEQECKSYEYELKRLRRNKIKEEICYKEIDIIEGIYVTVMKARSENDISELFDNYIVYSETVYPEWLVLVDAEDNHGYDCINIFSLNDYNNGQAKIMEYIGINFYK